MAELIYQYFVVNFGDVAALRNVPVSWVVENELTVLVTAMVQVFLASRVYLGMHISYVVGDSTLDNNDDLAVNKTVNALPFGRTAPVLVFAFALVAFVAGTGESATSESCDRKIIGACIIQITVTIEESSALMSDILSSICLCYMLAPPRLGSMMWSESLKAVFMFTINRAILMSFIQIGMLSSYLYAINELYWIPFHLCKSKLYTNTLRKLALHVLNSRSGGSFQSQTSPWPPWRTPTINLTNMESGSAVRQSMYTSEWDVEKTAPSKENVGPEGNFTTPSPS
ncbi:hypothetical protein J3R83DRAFT_1743 [Lanmaoa asiatica]|nr:hypothetical protein J3R83DRAFT_1743 [Lanmaoa asiatica]